MKNLRLAIVGIVFLAIITCIPVVSPKLAVELGQAQLGLAWHPTIETVENCEGFTVMVNPDWAGNPGTIVDQSGPLSGNWANGDHISGWVYIEWRNGQGELLDHGTFDWEVNKPTEGCAPPPPTCPNEPPPTPETPPTPCVPKVIVVDPQTVQCLVPLAAAVYSVEYHGKSVGFRQMGWNNIQFTNGDLMAGLYSRYQQGQDDSTVTVTLVNDEIIQMQPTPNVDHGYSSGCFIKSSSTWTPGYTPEAGRAVETKVSSTPVVIPCPPTVVAIPEEQ